MLRFTIIFCSFNNPILGGNLAQEQGVFAWTKKKSSSENQFVESNRKTTFMLYVYNLVVGRSNFVLSMSCLVMGTQTRKPETRGKNPTFLVPEPEKWYSNLTRTRLLLPEPIYSDVFGLPKIPKTRRKPDIFGTRPEPGKWYPNPTFATRTHH